jgi:DNA repair photolyase
MSIFTASKGAAAEYLPEGGLSLNPYEGICPIGCSYCYSNAMQRRLGKSFRLRLKDRFFKRLEKDAAKLVKSGFRSRVHLTFIGDAYAPGLEATTRQTLEILKAHGLNWQMLTKRPSAAVKDLDLYGPGCWLGTTYTGRSWEEEGKAGGSDHPDLRLDLLGEATLSGVSTWASVEPMAPGSQHVLDALDAAEFVAVGGQRGETWFGIDNLREIIIEEAGSATGWLLKQSLRVGLDPPYSGNLVECGWESPECNPEGLVL